MRTDSRQLLAVGIFGANSRIGERIEVLLRGRRFSPRASLSRVVTSAAILAGLLLAATLAPPWIGFAQQTAFEVASVKLNTSNAHTNYGLPRGDRFTAVNTSLKNLIGLAWKLRAYEVFNAPGWVDSERYDISARTAESSIPEDRFRLMLQALLADRFKLSAHRETREESVYALTAAKGGIKVEESKAGGCSPFVPGGAPLQPGDPPPCGALNFGPNFLAGYRITPALMIRGLSELLGRPVLDQTDYTGAFDFHLEFKMEGVASWGPGGFGRPELSAGGTTDDSSLPTVFTALQEKLGLTLQTQRAQVDVLVVDHVERPTEN